MTQRNAVHAGNAVTHKDAAKQECVAAPKSKAAKVLSKLVAQGFHRSLSGLKLDGCAHASSDQELQATLTVDDSMLNTFGTLHGGLVATLVDDLGSLAVAHADRFGRFGVTTDLQVSYLAPAQGGEVLQVQAEVLQSGLRLAFACVNVKRGDTLVATGRMTKLLEGSSLRA